ncbi:hypothetical protein HYX16_04305 [Candidatus Woesearchaeota archaeon]|nr:hypothetical protein [Candidatus Woesearchaeota archaeon]
MLENIRKRTKVIAASALVLAAGSSLGYLYYRSMSRREQEMRIFDSFDKDVVSKEVKYHFANEIKADVIYRQKEGKKSLFLKLLDDPNGLLVGCTKNELLIGDAQKEDSPAGSTYYVELDKNRINYREIHATFQFFEPIFNKSVDASIEVRIHMVKVGEEYKDIVEVKTAGSRALQEFIDMNDKEIEGAVINKMPEIDRILSVDDLVENLINLKK